MFERQTAVCLFVCLFLSDFCLVAGSFCNLFILVQTFADVLAVLNSSVNFVVYYTMGTKLRMTVREMARAAACAGQGRTAQSKPVRTASQDRTGSALSVFTVSHERTASAQSVSAVDEA